MKKLISLVLLLSISFLVFGQSKVVKIDSKNFTFAVLGDRTAGANQEIFEQIIRTIKLLNTDFVINVGDLIEGYSKIEVTIKKEWDSIFVNLGDLKDKFYFTPGNHDIWDSLSYQIYRNRTGLTQPYYTYSIGKNHFVVLDNSRQEKVAGPDTMQLRWLVSELTRYKKNDNIFCFMHRSFWKDAYNTSSPDTFHKLFVKYGVDYVFSGHDHFYCQLVWDGITYTQVGPSGSRYKEFRKEEFGAFQNFVKVSVINDKVQINVLKPDGSESASNIVTFQDMKELQNIEQAVEITQMGITTSRICFGGGPNLETTIYLDTIIVQINNLLDIPLNTIGKWDLKSGHYRITPLERLIYIAPKKSRSFQFHWKIESESIYPLPQFAVSYPYSKGTKHFIVSKMFTPIRNIETKCYQTQKPIKIDGKLTEMIWQNTRPVNIFGSSDGSISQTDPWQVWFAYDNVNIYIAIRMTDYESDKILTTITKHDERVYNDDHINIVLQPNPESDTYYQFFVNANGVVLDRMCQMQGKDSKKDAKWDSNITTQTNISPSGWILETAIPLKDFPDFNSDAWGFNLVRFQSSKNTVSTYSVPFEHNPRSFAVLKFIK